MLMCQPNHESGAMEGIKKDLFQKETPLAAVWTLNGHQREGKRPYSIRVRGDEFCL